MKARYPYAVFAAALAILASGCSKATTSPTTTTQGSPGASSTAFNNKGTKDVSGAQSVEVEQDTYYFEPTILKGSPGQKLTINLKNESKVEHNFTLEAQSINTDVEGGSKASVSVTFPASGTLNFYCRYHQALGMKGQLTTS